MFAVEHRIRELRNPIAEYHHARLAREDEVEFDVAVAIYEIVYVGMGLHVLLGVQHEVLALLAHVGRFHSVDTLEARVLSPSESEPHAPARMERTEQYLTEAVVEHTLYELELAVGVAQSVAVRQIEHLVVYLHRLRTCMNYHSALVVQIAIRPDGVVAREVVHLNAHIGKLRQFAEEARVALGHRITPLIPKVEHVAQQIYGTCLGLYRVKKTHKPALLSAAVFDSPRPEVGVRKEIYVLHPNNSKSAKPINSKLNNSKSAKPTIQHSTLNIQHSISRVLSTNQNQALREPLRSSCSGPIRVRTRG